MEPNDLVAGNEETPQERKQEIIRITGIGAVANLLLIVVKFAAGIWGHSSAMIADAVHSLSDFATDVVVMIFAGISAKPRDVNHDYGHGKFETLATLVIGLVLLIVGVGILREGALKIYDWWLGNPPLKPSSVAFYAALISIVVKEILYRVTNVYGKRLGSKMLIANAWHHRSDALSSVGTAIGIGGATFFGAQWTILDPIAAVVVSVFIIKVALELMLPCLKDLLEHSLPDEVENEILKIIVSIPGASDPHNLKTRMLGNDMAIDVHFRVRADMPVFEAHHIASEIEDALRHRFGNGTLISTHIEPAYREDDRDERR